MDCIFTFLFYLNKALFLLIHPFTHIDGGGSRQDTKHLDTWAGGARGRTANPVINGLPVPLPEPQPPSSLSEP